MDQYSNDPFGALGADAEAAAKRHDSRDSLFLMADLTVAGHPAEQVRVRNVSSGGLMAEYGAMIEIGTRLQIKLRGVGMVAGRVAWATDGRIGIAFDEAIDPMLTRKPVGSREDPRRIPYRG